MRTREEMEAEAKKIVNKVSEATKLGGGFMLYVTVAPKEIVGLVETEIRGILQCLVSLVGNTSMDSDGWEHAALYENSISDLIADLQKRLIP